MNNPNRIVVLTLALLLIAVTFVWPAGNLSDSEHWAWSENAGWLNFKTTHGGVTVHASHLSGYLWGENIGWVKLGADAGGPYGNTTANNWGVNRDGLGDLSGYGWSENAGWVNFGPTHGGVHVNALTGDLSGFAWAENLGFVHLANPAPAYEVQLVVPQLPLVMTTDPEASTWSSVATVDVEWSGASGNDLGLGYSFLFDTSSSTAPDATIDLVHASDPHSSTSAALADGEDHWFHLSSCDSVGNCSPVAHRGPFFIDNTAPRVALVHTVPDTGDGQLRDGEVTRASITQLYVSLDEVVADDGGGALPGDVTNLANWLLVGAGPDGVMNTASCTAAAGDDVTLVVDQVAWDSPTTTARLGINGGIDLARGRYRLLACSAIVDHVGNPLDGDGDGIGGDDFVLEWTVSADNLLSNPNLDQNLAGWDLSSGAEIIFGVDDAGEAPTSGSVAMSNLTGAAHELWVSQCIVVDDSQGHYAEARVWMDSGIGTAPQAYAEVIWYDAAACGGVVLGTGVTPPVVGDTGVGWKRFGGWMATPPGSVSAHVSFVLSASGSADFEANLDDLLLIEMLYGDGFEWGTTDAWSAATP